MTSAEIITIGTEILLGEIVDTNTRHIALTLRGLGVDLYRTITIGDNTDRIASAIHNSMERANIVITTGGLGPTIDDPTREAVAKAVGVETEFREELWEQVVETIGRYGRKPSENQKRQAYVPQGAIGLKNPVGTAPCFIVERPSPPTPLPNGERGDRVVISLPGVPAEMEHILHESVIPYLQKKFNLHEIIKVRVLHCAGLGEGMIDEKIADLEMLSNPTVGLAAHTGVVDVRITAKAKNEIEANALIDEIESQVRERLGNAVFGIDEDTLEEVTLNLLSKKGLTLTAIESGLDGLLTRKIKHAASFADLSPASLMDALRHAQTSAQTDIAIGVTIFPEERSAVMAMITSKGEKSHKITYGGPPKSLPKWSVNLTINWLRTTLEEMN
jgi:competence/damage-inducible protein CinA-like protein